MTVYTTASPSGAELCAFVLTVRSTDIVRALRQAFVSALS
jgi:hypothetical protein